VGSALLTVVCRIRDIADLVCYHHAVVREALAVIANARAALNLTGPSQSEPATGQIAAFSYVTDLVQTGTRNLALAVREVAFVLSVARRFLRDGRALRSVVGIVAAASCVAVEQI
jgi:hypothetical protein